MKSFFFRSKLLILIFSISACFLTLSSAAIMKFQFSEKKILEGLSDDYAIGELKSTDYEDENGITINDLFMFIKNIDNTYILAKQFFFSRGIGIAYSNEENFTLPLVSGRMFDKKDFDKHTNTIIVSEDIVDDCEQRDSKMYYIHDNEEYEVIGIYQGELGNVSDEILYYVNLEAQKLQNKTAIGTYILDTGMFSLSDFNKLKTYVVNLNDQVLVDFNKGLSSGASKFSNLMTNSIEMIFIVFVGGSLVLLNSFSATIVWILARKREIGIRKMLGSTDGQIYSFIMKQYIVLIGASFLLGMLPAFLIVHFSTELEAIPTVYLLFGDKINMNIISLAFIMLFAEGFVMLLIILGIYKKRRIIENVR